MKLIDFPPLGTLGMQKTRDFVFEYCPRGYIEGGYYFLTKPSTAGFIRMRVVLERGSYLRKYGNSNSGKPHTIQF